MQVGVADAGGLEAADPPFIHVAHVDQDDAAARRQCLVEFPGVDLACGRRVDGRFVYAAAVRERHDLAARLHGERPELLSLEGPRRVGRAPLPVDVVHGNALSGRLAPRLPNIGLEGRARAAERAVEPVVGNTQPAAQL